MKTIEMEVALMRHFGVRRNYIVPNVSWGIFIQGNTLHECDLLVLTKSLYATEVEIKVSMGDLKKDKEKKHGHSSPLIRKLYFAITWDMYMKNALKYIPGRAGVIVVKKDVEGTFVQNVREAKINTQAIKWGEEDLFQLLRLGTIRILGLKEKIIKCE